MPIEMQQKLRMVKQKEDLVGAYLNSQILTCISFHQSQSEKQQTLKELGITP